MAVLCEALSVLVPVSVLEAKFPGGMQGYAEAVPNGTFCSDGMLTRVGFMHPTDAQSWVEYLERFGLAIFAPEKGFIDLVVARQESGATQRCDWLQSGAEGGDRWAWMSGYGDLPRAAPDDWCSGRSRAFHLRMPEDVRESSPTSTLHWDKYRHPDGRVEHTARVRRND